MMRFFDLHCDTLYKCLENNKNFYWNGFEVSLENTSKYDTYVGCFAVWIPDEFRGEKALDLFNRAADKLGFQKELFAQKFEVLQNSEGIGAIVAPSKNNGIGVILTIEGGAAIAGKLENLDYIRSRGVRIMTLTWNGRCEIGDGVEVQNPSGLSDFGKKVIPRMEELGIIVDVSHASEKLFYDVCENSKKPFIATHSNSKKVCNHIRNLSDEQFEIIKNKKGLVGINFCKDFLSENHTANMDDVRAHIEHFLGLGGEYVISFGSDFDGCDISEEISGIERVENLYEYFLRKNYNQKLIDAIFFDNAHNFMLNNL